MTARKSEKEQPKASQKHCQPGSHLFILSAPSGAGKTTLRHAVQEQFPDMLYSISYTTRPARTGEQNGVDYHFVDRDEFEEGIAAGRWAEWASVHENYYGTSADFVDQALAGGKDVLLDIDVQGTRQVLKRYPDCITVFIMPPSLDVLQSRLKERGTDSAEVIAVRLENARKEMAQKDLYRHIVVNDRLSDAIAELNAIIESYRAQR